MLRQRAPASCRAARLSHRRQMTLRANAWKPICKPTNRLMWFSFSKTKRSQTTKHIATIPRTNVPGARLIGSKASSLKGAAAVCHDITRNGSRRACESGATPSQRTSKGKPRRTPSPHWRPTCRRRGGQPDKADCGRYRRLPAPAGRRWPRPQPGRRGRRVRGGRLRRAAPGQELPSRWPIRRPGNGSG